MCRSSPASDAVRWRRTAARSLGGVILMANGENPLEVTRRIKAKIREIQAGLPPDVRIVPFYDRTPLIEGAIETVSGTVIEAMISASLCVLVILLHLRTSLVIAGTLPLAALSSFLIMAVLRRSGIVDIPANAMSLAGIAISIGVLVDSSVVMAENVMHRLRERFGSEPVRGDVCDVVESACLAVGRPIVFSVAIMVLSFLPVFALGGMEGKMFHPLAYTKTFALVSVAFLAITMVPALCTIFIRGRLRSEQENPLVRGVIEVYRPGALVPDGSPGGASRDPGRDVPPRPRPAGEPASLPGNARPGDGVRLPARGQPLGGRRRSCLPRAFRPRHRADDRSPVARVHDAAR